MESGKSKQLKTLAVVIVGVIVLVGAVYAFMEYQRGKPATPVRDLTVQFAAGETTQDVPPYTVCELDQECAGGEAPSMPLGGSSEVAVRVPDDVASISWRLLLIYDDPEQNEERIFQSGQAREDTVQAVTESGAHLVVAEVSALTVDADENGEETPVIATWSMGFQAD